MLFRKWLAVAVSVFWLSFWTLFLQVDASKHDYSDESSSDWDWKLQQFKYLVDKSGRKAGCGTDSVLIAILLFLPLVGLLGLVAPLMLFILPLLLGPPAVVSGGGLAGVGGLGGPQISVAGRRRKRSLDQLTLSVVPHFNRTTELTPI